ncbi:YhcH/YjgK/YiaL family protein [Paenibacillus oceani]|uniref:YhcH/YjgK/YiaL family protein n=1 Tax=Paenibacillus oceani TaxID=2772510 RepID=A0A927GXT1_9BACL|nr:YhcH/YjgK/YiaL family protein [Paenibacillus oceani]MBD2861166.1 YhcH/YjgK/YiaL family protein [Paenibacillus oceani]
MIYDKIANLPQYAFLNPRMASCVTDLMAGLDEETDGTQADFAKNRIEFATAERNEKRFEAHRKYIDVHVVLEGTEYVEVTHVDNLTNATEYDSESDYLLGDASSTCVFGGYLEPGSFLICFPEDAHRVGPNMRASILRCIPLMTTPGMSTASG